TRGLQKHSTLPPSPHSVSAVMESTSKITHVAPQLEEDTPAGNVMEAEQREQQPLHDSNGVVETRWPVMTVIKILVMIDMLSVALLVPVLSSYFQDLGIR
ncbi:unnamed protein product, partial [Sphacelaria rigidula]